jgi:peptide-methionine (R)-S-oxide reductase
MIMYAKCAILLASVAMSTGCGDGDYPVPGKSEASSTTKPAGQSSSQASPARVEKTQAQWKAELPPETFHVMFEAGTERPFANAYYNNHEKGTYVSAATGATLFNADDKFESGTGWPSFTKPVDPSAVILRPDPDGSGRAEVLDASSGGHLGHLFKDGPQPLGDRYCMNSAAMKFVPAEKK